jgi:hypothetical protein
MKHVWQTGDWYTEADEELSLYLNGERITTPCVYESPGEYRDRVVMNLFAITGNQELANRTGEYL